MVLLYSDSKEESKNNLSPSLELQQTTTSSVTQKQSELDWEEKVALLQQSLEKKDKIIADLKSENEILKVSILLLVMLCFVSDFSHMI